MTDLEEARQAVEAANATYDAAIKDLAEQIATGVDEALNMVVTEVVRNEPERTRQLDPADIAILKVNLGTAAQSVEQRLRADGSKQIQAQLALLGRPPRGLPEVIGAASRVLEHLTTPFNELLTGAGFKASVCKKPFSNRMGYELGPLGLEDYPLLRAVEIAADRAAAAKRKLGEAERNAEADDASDYWKNS